jgi:endonuclease YncB( thermonuclease family)
MATPAHFSLVVLLLAGCTSTRDGRRYSKEEASAALRQVEVISLELGLFPLDGAAAVIDGDTIRVRGLSASLRLLAIDTEETFKRDNERQAFSRGWESYKKDMRGKSQRPVKMATPVGDDAKHFAEAFFDGVQQVKLERDHPGEIRDYYNRYLAYVLVQKQGQWVNYNLECVRAGMSPYFTKYGRSRRFHQAFVAAQEEARTAQRGIWRPGAQHYDDYDERLTWWNERESVITRFEKDAETAPDVHIALTRWDALRRLEQKVGQEVVVLGAVSDLRFGGSGPAVVRLARTRTNDFDVIFFDRDVLVASGLQFKKGEYVQVKGQVGKYRDRRGQERLQLQVTLPGQVVAPSRQLQELLSDDKNAVPAESEEGD